jgi:DNA-binding response OmpR family regulator
VELRGDSSPARRILIVEDDAALLLALTDRLTQEGYQVDSATDGNQGSEMLAAGAHELVILDVMLPGRNGFEVAREARNQGLDTPILMLTARGEVTDRVVGLEFGADDYLTKPFEFIELLARMQALLRRAERPSAKAASEKLEYGDVRIDTRSAQVFLKDELVTLSSKEMQLLQYFMENTGVALTRDGLLDAVWGYDTGTNTRTVDVHVGRLRQKLEAEPNNPKIIITVRGLGYRFGQ